MKVLVFGSRTFDDHFAVYWVLDGLLEHARADRDDNITVIEGGARGADRIAASWAVGRVFAGVEHERYPADWNLYGKAAGPYRNEYMLRHGKPDVAWGFLDKDLPHSRGSHDMAMKCVAAGVPTYIVQKL